jgi:hypothetical protein
MIPDALPMEAIFPDAPFYLRCGIDIFVASMKCSPNFHSRLPPQRISLHSVCAMPPSQAPRLLAVTSERLRAAEVDLEHALHRNACMLLLPCRFMCMCDASTTLCYCSVDMCCCSRGTCAATRWQWWGQTRR